MCAGGGSTRHARDAMGGGVAPSYISVPGWKELDTAVWTRRPKRKPPPPAKNQVQPEDGGGRGDKEDAAASSSGGVGGRNNESEPPRKPDDGGGGEMSRVSLDGPWEAPLPLSPSSPVGDEELKRAKVGLPVFVDLPEALDVLNPLSAPSRSLRCRFLPGYVETGGAMTARHPSLPYL